MNNKWILVTGSSNGIGAGIVKYFGSKGFNVIITYLKDKKSAEKVSEDVIKMGQKTFIYQMDVRSEESVSKVFEDLNTKIKKLDVLVNNAAVDYAVPIETGSFEDWQNITRTKIDGNFLCTRYALPLLLKSDSGNLIIIMSSMFERVDPLDPAYCVGTAGTVTFMKCMALALAKYKIRTNGISPGETQTNNQWWKDLGNKKEMWADIAKSNPLERVTTTEDVAKATWMIVNDETNFLNGNIIYVNGGGHLK